MKNTEVDTNTSDLDVSNNIVVSAISLTGEGLTQAFSSTASEGAPNEIEQSVDLGKQLIETDHLLRYDKIYPELPSLEKEDDNSNLDDSLSRDPANHTESCTAELSADVELLENSAASHLKTQDSDDGLSVPCGDADKPRTADSDHQRTVTFAPLVTQIEIPPIGFENESDLAGGSLNHAVGEQSVSRVNIRLKHQEQDLEDDFSAYHLVKSAERIDGDEPEFDAYQLLKDKPTSSGDVQAAEMLPTEKNEEDKDEPEFDAYQLLRNPAHPVADKPITCDQSEKTEVGDEAERGGAVESLADSNLPPSDEQEKHFEDTKKEVEEDTLKGDSNPDAGQHPGKDEHKDTEKTTFESSSERTGENSTEVEFNVYQLLNDDNQLSNMKEDMLNLVSASNENNGQDVISVEVNANQFSQDRVELSEAEQRRDDEEQSCAVDHSFAASQESFHENSENENEASAMEETEKLEDQPELNDDKLTFGDSKVAKTAAEQRSEDLESDTQPGQSVDEQDFDAYRLIIKYQSASPADGLDSRQEHIIGNDVPTSNEFSVMSQPAQGGVAGGREVHEPCSSEETLTDVQQFKSFVITGGSTATHSLSDAREEEESQLSPGNVIYESAKLSSVAPGALLEDCQEPSSSVSQENFIPPSLDPPPTKLKLIRNHTERYATVCAPAPEVLGSNPDEILYSAFSETQEMEDEIEDEQENDIQETK